jgi:hypothetical protein
MSTLQATNADIRRRMQHERRLREERRLAALPIRTIDALLAELEELHLDGRKRVPETFDPRFEALMATLPSDCRLELRSRITIVHLMDRLYAIQDRLLSQRTEGRSALRDASNASGEAGEDDFLPQAS